MNRHLRVRRQRTRIAGAIAAVLVVGALGWLLFTHLPHGAASTAKPGVAAAVKGPQATLTAAAAAAHATPVTCPTVKVPGLNGTPTNSGGPPVITGTVQTGAQCLQWVDVKPGSGAAVKAGDTVTVNYTGWLLSGQKFDSSLDQGRTPFQVQNVGNAQVIPGWNMGLIGMKVGDERELIIPPALGYGANGNQGIPGNATLIFVISVVSIP
jgi:peptidylprolyl isomerase